MSSRFLIAALCVVSLSLGVLLAIGRARADKWTIVVAPSEGLHEGSLWSGSVKLSRFEGDGVRWTVTDQHGEPIEAYTRQRGNGWWLIEIPNGLVRPVEAHLNAHVDGRIVDRRRLGNLIPKLETISVDAEPALAATINGSQLVVRAGRDWPTGRLPELRLLRTNAGTSVGGLSWAKWTDDGGWEWRWRIPHAANVHTVEVEVREWGPTRHLFEFRGVNLVRTPERTVVTVSRPIEAKSSLGVLLVLPPQQSASDRADRAKLLVNADRRFRLVHSPSVIHPAPADFGLTRWDVQMDPEPEYAVPEGTGAGISPNTPRHGTSEPHESGPLLPLTLELMVAPDAHVPPPRVIGLAVRRAES